MDRAAFEDHEEMNGLSVERLDDGEYKSDTTHIDWLLWKRATTAERQRCAKVLERMIGQHLVDHADHEADNFVLAERGTMRDCRDAILRPDER